MRHVIFPVDVQGFTHLFGLIVHPTDTMIVLCSRDHMEAMVHPHGRAVLEVPVASIGFDCVFCTLKPSGPCNGLFHSWLNDTTVECYRTCTFSRAWAKRKPTGGYVRPAVARAEAPRVQACVLVLGLTRCLDVIARWGCNVFGDNPTLFHLLHTKQAGTYTVTR